MCGLLVRCSGRFFLSGALHSTSLQLRPFYVIFRVEKDIVGPAMQMTKCELHKLFTSWVICLPWICLPEMHYHDSFINLLTKLFFWIINSYNVIRQCWESEPNSRPSFTDLCQKLQELLEAAEQVNFYMNYRSSIRFGDMPNGRWE